MLAMANKHGFVFASIPGLANRARVSIEATEEAIKKFQQPDPYSRTKDFDGRRIEEVDGGWKLLNYAKHRAIRDEEERREYMANLMRKKRAVSKISHSEPPLAQAEAEAEAEAEKKQNPQTPFEKPAPSASLELDIYSAAKTLGEMIGYRRVHTLKNAIEQAERRWQEKPRDQVILDIVALWRAYTAQGLHTPVAIHNWLDGVGSYIDSDHWKKPKAEEFKPQIDWQGGYVGPDGVYVNKRGQRVPGFICPPNPNGKGTDA